MHKAHALKTPMSSSLVTSSSNVKVQYFCFLCCICMVPRMDLVRLPPCGQRRYGPADGTQAESKERKRQEGAKAELGFLPGPTHGGFSQESCVLVRRPTCGPFRDTQASGAGQKLGEEGGGLVRTFYRSAHPPVSSHEVQHLPCFSANASWRTLNPRVVFRKAVAASVDPPNLVVYVAQDCTSESFLSFGRVANSAW